ncbi:hypothetical protein [Ralstonia phage RP31]|nr:hypothetical protein [Ralstonia phage RP31]
MSNGMSVFQMDNFVIKDQITPYRKLRQIIVETRARLENITSIGFDIEELQIKKQQAEQAKEKVGSFNKLESQLQDVQIRRYEFELNRKQSILSQQNAEVQFFNDQLIKLADEHFGGKEKLLKELQDPNFHAVNEAHFWTHKLARGVHSDLINFGTINKGTLEAILNLPLEQQQSILSLAQGQAIVTQNALRDVRDQQLALQDR